MNKKHYLFCIGVLAFVAVWLTGCCTCQENRGVGMAEITCQPMDTSVYQGQAAVFKVEATGTDLTYQWYFRGGTGCGAPVGGANGDRTATLTVPNVNNTRIGRYWCEIDSMGELGPVRSRTRDAYLGTKNAPPPPNPGDGLQVFPAQNASMPPGNSAKNICGDYCGYILYNNNGNGFKPATGTTHGIASVQIGTGTRPNSEYQLMWRASSTSYGCATDLGTTEKQFTSNPNKTYAIIVYFRPTFCPAENTIVTLNLRFDP